MTTPKKKLTMLTHHEFEKLVFGDWGHVMKKLNKTKDRIETELGLKLTTSGTYIVVVDTHRVIPILIRKILHEYGITHKTRNTVVFDQRFTIIFFTPGEITMDRMAAYHLVEWVSFDSRNLKIGQVEMLNQRKQK